MPVRYQITLFILLVWMTTAKAQYIAVQAGWALPSGSFGNTVLSNKEDGFATSGSTFSLFTNYLLSERLGICADIRYASMGFDQQALSEQAGNQAPPLTQMTASSQNNYTSSSAMAGLSYTLGNQNLTFDIRVMTGFLTLRTPTLTYTTTYNGQAYNRIIESQNDLSLAFGYGIGAKYALPKNWFIVANIDNTFASMEFPENGYQSSSNTTVTKPYQVYLLSAGIGYKIQ